MKRTLAFLSILSLGALAHAGPVQSVPASVQQPPSFKQVDVNHDGAINRHEAVSAGVLTKEEFKAADTDDNGKLNKGEYRQAMAGKQRTNGMKRRQGS
ncbi:MAG TPA: EF-hand domain-containing protein [Gammaproteobacteria bacterium]|nr:EF-hand domain-containing protein [Gammaproteobacteria bacterium]